MKGRVLWLTSMSFTDDSAPYEIIEDELFKFQAAEFAGSIKRWDEISWGFTHTIAMNPHAIVPPFVGVPNFYSVQVPAEPPLLLHYLVDDRMRAVHFLQIELLEP